MTLSQVQIDGLSIYCILAALALILTAGSNAKPRHVLALVGMIVLGALGILFAPAMIDYFITAVPLEST